ncbi:ADAM DEC1 [Saimiri boliviensis]|uniref:ADAM like decysin 1 n=1 Tax=Saimiri boliviensis boliviensis TaxID=39432 RepID=A0A2K6T117_SAIBB|nr:ADAM DEC1 isoform X1 [Saimiri boliviensis boliviensis]
MLRELSQLPAVATMSWVLLSALWLIVQTQAIAIKQTPELILHEIVSPKKLHILHKREIENNHTEKHGKEERYDPEVQYQMILNGKEVILSLQKTKHLLGPDYTETFYSPRGEEITTKPENMEHCYYKGSILNEKSSVASISTCNGLRGYFTHHHQTYLIKPLKSTDQEEHAVFTSNQEERDPANHTCASVRSTGREHGTVRMSRSLKSPEQEDFLRAQKYIDLYLVVDNAFYTSYKENLTLIRSFVFDVMNLLNVIYNTIDVHVALVGMEIWSDGDKINVVPSTATTFNNFLTWHRSNLGKKKIHDHAQLLSGIGFNNRRVGMAASNSLCSPSSVAVIEAKRKNNVALVGVMSHELGHVLGMLDVPFTTKCPSGSCVMNQYLSSKFPKDFSTSCRSRFERYLLSQKPRCLLQAPIPTNIMTTPVCGNHLLEVGEDCDCGSPKECTDLCCEALTCKLKSGTDCEGDTSNHTIE